MIFVESLCQAGVVERLCHLVLVEEAEDGIDVSCGEPPWVDLTPSGHKMKQLPARAFQPATPETTRRFMFGCSCAQLMDVSFG